MLFSRCPKRGACATTAVSMSGSFTSCVKRAVPFDFAFESVRGTCLPMYTKSLASLSFTVAGTAWRDAASAISPSDALRPLAWKITPFFTWTESAGTFHCVGGGGHEHRARGGAGLPVLLERIGDRGGAARALRGPPHQVVVERGVGRRAFDAHLRPGGVEFLGDERGQAGVHPLAHLEVLDDDGDGVVLADAQERVRREGAGRRGADGLAGAGHLRGGVAEVDAERETRAGGGGGTQEDTTGHRAGGSGVAGTHAHRIHVVVPFSRGPWKLP